jgi:hypothetical protein
MFPGMSSVARTITGAMRFGSMSRKMIRVLPAPSERLASTNSFSRSESVLPPHDAGDVRPGEEDDHGDHDRQPGWISPPRQPLFVVLHAADDPDRDQELGHREHHVGGAGEERVEPASVEAGEEADDEPDQHRDPRGDDPDEERGARAVHRADEEVAARGVCAEPELPVRPLGNAVVVGHRRRVGLVLRMPGDALRERPAERSR